MVGSWPCKVSSEIHINGQRVSEQVREDKVLLQRSRTGKKIWVTPAGLTRLARRSNTT
jgi:hypothetical protein